MRVAQANEGLEHDAFEDLVRRQSRFVYRVAFGVLRSVPDAEDVVQETFLRIYRKGAWRKMADERAFLARAAWRIAVSRLTRRPRVLLDEEVASEAQSPENAAVEADWNIVIHRMIDALPEDIREVLAMSALEGFSSKQVSDATGIPEGTVRTRLMRARQMLREKLTRLMEVRHAE